MTHTTTEECEFTVNTSGALASSAVTEAMKLLAAKAQQKGFEHEIGSTFEVRVTRANNISGMYEIRAKAAYAKIVLVPQEAPGPYDAPGVGTAEYDSTPEPF